MEFGADWQTYRYYFEGETVTDAQTPEAEGFVKVLLPEEKLYIFKAATESAFRSEALTIRAPGRAVREVTLTIDYLSEATGESLPRTYEYTYGNPSGGAAEWLRGEARKLELEPSASQRTLYYRVRATDTLYASEYASLVLAPRPSAPTTVQYDADAHKITGVDATMEFRLGTGDWTPVTGTEIEAYPGSYEIRNKATDGSFASNVVPIYVQGQEQGELTLEGFRNDAVYGDTFTVIVRQTGEQTAMAIRWTATGCAAVDGSGKVTITGVGPYAITAERPGDQIYTAVSKEENGVAGKRTVTVEWKNHEDRVYNGLPSELTVLLGNLVSGDATSVTAVITDGDKTNAGRYNARIARLTGDKAEYYKLPMTGTSKSYVINRAVYDMEGVTLEDLTVAYDGTDKFGALEIEGFLPENVEVRYEYYFQGRAVTQAIRAGAYTVKAIFTGDAVNYERIPDMTATLTIRRSGIAVTVTWDATSFDYNGREQAPEAIFKDAAGSVIDLSAEASYAGDYATSIDAGTYTVTVTIDSIEYELTGENTTTYTINKAVLTAPTFTGTLIYNGQEQDVTAYLSDFNAALVTVSGGTGRNAGAYTAILTLSESALRNCSWAGTTGASVQVSWKIDKAQIAAEWSTDEFVADGSGHAPELTGFTGMIAGDFEKISVSYTGDLDKTESGSYKVFAALSNKENEDVLRNYEVTGLEWAYAITPRAGMNVVTVEWSEDEFVYNGGVQYPKAIVKDREGNVLDVEVTYSGDYTDSKYAGEYTVTATVPGNYFIKSGGDKSYTIEKNDQGEGAPPADPTDPTTPPTEGDKFPLWQVIVTGVSLLILMICAIVAIADGRKASEYKGRKRRAETRMAGVAVLPLTLLGAPLLGMGVTGWTALAITMAALAVCASVGTGIFSAHVGKLRYACEDAEARAEETKERKREESRLAELRRLEEERKLEEQRRREEREEERRRDTNGARKSV